MNPKTTMQLGMIGLGRMGANMVRRLINDGHRCVVFDRSSEVVKDFTKDESKLMMGVFMFFSGKKILCLVMKTVNASQITFRDQICLRLQPVLHLVTGLRTVILIGEVSFPGHFVR